ncbi:AMP-binding protein [Flavobacterium psychraquaticum]|uniref:AMP-binding protein n=1 Tax=Flavobacterium psychraquaticum TaxID=3103958 RepID=UPI002ACDC05B|nr:AMP-binding protein [Flavobacterium sp. LB-N7T]
MTPNYTNIHNRFKINGVYLNREGLFQLGFNGIKEGDDYEKDMGLFILDWIDENETIQLMTSGTTGIPKLITLQKQAMVNSAIATADFFNLRPGDKALHCLPTKYIAGKMMLIRAIIIGLELDIVAPSSHIEIVPSKKYDFTAIVPMQAQASFSVLNQFKKIIIGGAKIDLALVEKLSACSADIYETYGMTETITHIAAKKIGVDRFKVLPHIKISKDERGCLIIQAPNITDEIIVTNDLVEIYNDIEFQWFGRYDNVINSGGIKYIPEQIESKLAVKLKHRFFIAGMPDSVLGQKIVLFIEAKKFPVEAAFFDILEKFERPKETYFLPKFIEKNNKIRRFEMVKNQLLSF